MKEYFLLWCTDKLLRYYERKILPVLADCSGNSDAEQVRYTGIISALYDIRADINIKNK